MKRYRMKSLSWLLCGMLASLSLIMLACSDNSNGPCQSDYNCPTDKPYCVARVCVTSLPGQEVPSGQEASPDTNNQEASTGQEATSDASVQDSTTGQEAPPEPTGSGCATQKDCTEATPWCRFGQCSEGYIYFDFTKGQPILEPSQDLQTTCTSNANCRSWQSCVTSGSTKFCYALSGRSSEAKGKIKDDGIFLQGRSYAYIIVENAKEIIRMRMIGELSDKLETHLEIDIPSDKMNSNTTLDIEKSNIKVRMYNVKIEFVPPIQELVAVGIRGDVVLTQAAKTYSTTNANSLLIGSADIVLKRP